MSMDDKEKIEGDSDGGSFAEEDWNDPEQYEEPKWTEPDIPMTTETRKGGRNKTKMRYNSYGDDFLIDKMRHEELGEALENVGELTAEEEWQIIDDSEHKEIDLEQYEIERRENTNLKIPEWLHKLESDEKEAQSIQQVDISAAKHVKAGNQLYGWTTTDRSLYIPPDKLRPAPSTETSIKNFVRGVGVGLTHTENLMIIKLREMRETNGLDLDLKEAEPTIGRNFKTKFEIPNEYSEIFLTTYSDFILSDRIRAICITADMSFNTRFETNFKRIPECGVPVQTETRIGDNG